MPKETIRSNNPDNNLIVKWGKESSTAQIGVEFEEWFTFHKDFLSGGEETPEYNSLWMHFDSRDEVNRTIRVLRKMRDDVFGKDA